MVKTASRFWWVLTAFTVLFAGVSFGQGPLTNALNLMVRSDSNGSLLVYGVAAGAQGPLTNLGNMRLRATNGALNVAFASGSSISCTQNAIAITSTDCFVAQNTTDATAPTTVQWSPRLRFTGTAWNSVGVASETDSFIIENRPVSVAGSTTSTLAFARSIAGNPYSDVLYLFSSGGIQTGGAMTSGGSISVPPTSNYTWAGRAALTSPADGQVTLTNAGASSGFGLQGGTADTMIVANRAQNAYGTADALAYKLSATLAFSSTAITAAIGSCTAPTVTANGTAAFTMTLGTGCSTSVGTVTLPAATTGWSCQFDNVTAPQSNIVDQTGGATTTATITNYARTTGLAANFTDSQVIRGSCVGY